MMVAYESHLSFAMSGRTIKYMFSVAPHQRIPFLAAIHVLSHRSTKEMWRKRLKLLQKDPRLIYIGQTGPTGDNNTKYVVLNSSDFSEGQIDQIAHWLYEKQSKELTIGEIDEPIIRVTVMDFYDLKAGTILSAFFMEDDEEEEDIKPQPKAEADDKAKAEDNGTKAEVKTHWYLSEHKITNEQLKKLLQDMDELDCLSILYN